MADSQSSGTPGNHVRIEPSGGVQRYLAALAGFDRNVKLLLTVTAFRGMVIATLSTILNLYLYSLGYDSRFIGVISAANSLAVLLFSVPLGYLADRVGRKPVLLAGGIGYPLTMLGLSIFTSTQAILLFNFLFGCVSCAYWVAGVPLLYASTDEHERVQAFSINSFLLWGFGPVGALLGGGVAEIAGSILHVSASSTPALRTAMFFMTALGALGCLPYWWMRDKPPRAATEEPPPAGRLVSLFARLLAPDLLLSFGLGAVLTFIQLYFHLRFGLNPGPIGLVVAIGGIASGAATLSTPVLARRWGNLRTAVRCQMLAAPLIGALALAMQLVLAVPAYWLVLMLRGMSDPVYTAFVQERVPEMYRARLTGLYSVTYSIGFSLGPAASGQIQKTSGFTPAFLMGGATYFVGALLLWFFFARRTRPSVAAMIDRVHPHEAGNEP